MSNIKEQLARVLTKRKADLVLLTKAHHMDKESIQNSYAFKIEKKRATQRKADKTKAKKKKKAKTGTEVPAAVPPPAIALGSVPVGAVAGGGAGDAGFEAAATADPDAADVAPIDARDEATDAGLAAAAAAAQQRAEDADLEEAEQQAEEGAAAAPEEMAVEPAQNNGVVALGDLAGL